MLIFISQKKKKRKKKEKKKKKKRKKTPLSSYDLGIGSSIDSYNPLIIILAQILVSLLRFRGVVFLKFGLLVYFYNLGNLN